MDASTVVVVTIVAALAFDIINGFHDAANSIATIVSTRVLSPRLAVLWAAAFNFVALWIFGEGVAKTIAGIIVIKPQDPAFVWVVMCGLLGAITWNVLTWLWGLPSSSSHALIGGVSGSGVAYAGFHVLVWSKIRLVLIFIVGAPLIGLVIGSVMMVSMAWLLRRTRPQLTRGNGFRVIRLCSAAAYSIGHGGNDAQKTMGVIGAVMLAGGLIATPAPGHGIDVPAWVVLASYACMAFGTAIGGWRIVKTMGMGLTNLRPIGGFSAEVAGAATLFTATHFRVPVSTTHTITGAIIGVGSTDKLRGIRWGLAGRIVWAWIFTIPAAFAVGYGALALARACGAW
ncbi:MAG TPA: inorganic phosphate transporter [Kofleriaceae bacterium]|nr:inorganic phosphate transporter [Kofleriaceae bacterium]